MWDRLWEFFSSILADEYRRDRLLLHLTLLGLSLLFGVYLLFLFLPYRGERLKAFNVVVLRNVELRKFKDEGEIRLQWDLEANKMSYDEFKKKSLLLKGRISIYSYSNGKEKVTVAEFQKAFTDELMKEFLAYELKVRYSGKVIYAREGRLIKNVLYLKDVRIFKKDVVTFSPRGKLKDNNLELENPINLKLNR